MISNITLWHKYGQETRQKLEKKLESWRDNIGKQKEALCQQRAILYSTDQGWWYQRRKQVVCTKTHRDRAWNAESLIYTYFVPSFLNCFLCFLTYVMSCNFSIVRGIRSLLKCTALLPMSRIIGQQLLVEKF